MLSHIGRGDATVLLLEGGGFGRGGVNELDVSRQISLGRHLAIDKRASAGVRWCEGELEQMCPRKGAHVKLSGLELKSKIGP